MLSPQSQLLERNLHLFEGKHVCLINPSDAYFTDLLNAQPLNIVHQFFDIFSESVRVIPSVSFDSRDVAGQKNGFCVEQRVGQHIHWFTPVIPDAQQFSDIVIYMPKAKAHFQMLLAMASASLEKNGRIFVVGENKGGIKSAGKVMQPFGNVSKVDSARHCSLICVTPEATAAPFSPDAWLDETEYDVSGTQWQVVSMPGVFSHGELDNGSRLLLEKMPLTPRKRILDFACGAGVVGSYLLTRFPHLDMSMLDVSAMALYCAARTLSANGQTATLIAANGLHGVEMSVDHVVTNPPFHTGLKTDYSVTKRFITDSRRILKDSGSLAMVANRFLPYPGLLGEIYGRVHTVAQNTQFTVYHAHCK